MTNIVPELINQEKLAEKISELETNYVAGLFQEFYYPLANEALSKEILEMEAEIETLEGEEKEEKQRGVGERRKQLKVNEAMMKSVAGTIGHLNKTLPYLKSFVKC